MKKLPKIALLSLVILISACQEKAQEKVQISSGEVIYGVDNRIDAFELDGGFWEEKARSVVMKVKNTKMKKLSNGKIKLLGKVLKDYKTMCANEKFVDQRLNADCTGFLIGEDIVATAGHCMKDKFDCEHFSWVFDYKLKGPDDKKYHKVYPENVFTCKKILTSAYARGKDLDFAIVQLDRKVEGRTPLELRTEGRVKDGTNLAIIGHPSGLPLKFADGAEVIKNTSKDFFSANLDSFQNNSGSPVFNQDTGVVEGILIRGDMDYHWAYKDKCNRVNIIKLNCKERDCRLEDVTRITKLPKS